MLRVYNTLTREKEEFVPLTERKVGMYVCGLTVQNYSHLGHIRSAINYDVIRRYLEYKGYEVVYVQNFTDINEKIVNRAREEGLTPEELADKYTKAYLEDIESLNIRPANYYVKATDYIDSIISIIKKIVNNGFAYQVNGNVYFSVENFKDYGKLSNRSLDDMQAGARIDVNEEKRNPMDFALWKKAPVGEKDWDSPWGRGWPGWHIECSAMSMEILGERFDIHGGGSDLIFPHHENEIAQSEACTGKKPFAKYWLHNGPVNLKGEKMSKSLGNFFTTRELLKKFSPEDIRYFLLTKSYRTPIDFTLEEVTNAGVSFQRLINTSRSMIQLINSDIDRIGSRDTGYEHITNNFAERRKEFEDAMDDDFNTARAIGVLHELARDINTFINDSDFILSEKTKIILEKGFKLLQDLTDVLGLGIQNKNVTNNDKIVDNLMDLILQIREDARENKNWELADRIRDGLQEQGFIIRDTPQGTVWEKESENNG
ncbi:MAG: cysteine--tRNA ligase [Halanaerobiaceae bacterium]